MKHSWRVFYLFFGLEKEINLAQHLVEFRESVVFCFVEELNWWKLMWGVIEVFQWLDRLRKYRKRKRERENVKSTNPHCRLRDNFTIEVISSRIALDLGRLCFYNFKLGTALHLVISLPIVSTFTLLNIKHNLCFSCPFTRHLRNRLSFLV